MWIEDSLNYSNGKIPHAFLLSGQWMYRDDILKTGLKSLEWLLKIQKDSSGHFTPVGNQGWYKRGGTKARFDQQPIEIHAMIDACMEAYNVTGDNKWERESLLCFEWFLGRNDLHIALYDHKTGGCYDGLQSDRDNRNQGAESTLAWLLSLLSMYKHWDTQTLEKPGEPAPASISNTSNGNEVNVGDTLNEK